MANKHSVLIHEKLYQDIKAYCQLNNLNTNEFICDMLAEQFMIEKYGKSPFDESKKKIEDDTVTVFNFDPKLSDWKMSDESDENETKDVEKTKSAVTHDMAEDNELKITENIDPLTLSHIYTIERKEWDEMTEKKVEEAIEKDGDIKETNNNIESNKPNKRRLK